jgi:hypothetical protein
MLSLLIFLTLGEWVGAGEVEITFWSLPQNFGPFDFPMSKDDRSCVPIELRITFNRSLIPWFNKYEDIRTCAPIRFQDPQRDSRRLFNLTPANVTVTFGTSYTWDYLTYRTFATQTVYDPHSPTPAAGNIFVIFTNRKDFCSTLMCLVIVVSRSRQSAGFRVEPKDDNFWIASAS